MLTEMSRWLKTEQRAARKEIEGKGRELLSYWAQFDRLFFKNGLIWRRWEEKGTDNELYQQLCIPKKMVPQILQELHNNPSSGHLGVNRTVKRVRERFYWLGLHDDVGNYVKACTTCAQVKDPPGTPKAPPNCVRAGHPLQRVAIDIVGPLPRSNSGHEWLLVILDYFTKFAQAFSLRNTTSESLVHKL